MARDIITTRKSCRVLRVGVGTQINIEYGISNFLHLNKTSASTSCGGPPRAFKQYE